MANRAGLKKVVKTVRGKKGTVKRSYWVKAGNVAKTVGKVALAGAAVAGALHLAKKRGLLASKNPTWHGSMAHSSNNTASTWHGSAAHQGGPSMRAKASMFRKDSSKAASEGRSAASDQYGHSRSSGFGRVASAYHALRAGHAVASNSFKGRRALRG